MKSVHGKGKSFHIVIYTLLVSCFMLLPQPTAHAFPKRMMDLEKKYLKTGLKYQVIDRKYFFSRVGKSFGSFRRFNTRQKQIYNMIFDFWDLYPELKDLRWLAYILGTGEYESAHRMYPVRETLAGSDDRAIHLMNTHKAYKKVRYWARTKHRGYYYWRRLKNHGNRTYLGRGLIQITHFENYRKWGKYMGMGQKLYLDPQLAYRPDIATQALIKGMILGVYRHDRKGRHSLARYFIRQTARLPASQQRKFYKRARSIVNGGLYHADKILVGAIKFRKLLKYTARKAGWVAQVTPTVKTGEGVNKTEDNHSIIYAQLEENKKLIAERDAEIARLNEVLAATQAKVRAQGQLIVMGKQSVRNTEEKFRGDKVALVSFTSSLEKKMQEKELENRNLWRQLEKNQEMLAARVAELNKASMQIMEYELEDPKTEEVLQVPAVPLRARFEDEINGKNKQIGLLNTKLKQAWRQIREIKYIEQRLANEKLTDERIKRARVERELYFSKAQFKRLKDETHLLRTLNKRYRADENNKISIGVVRRMITEEFSILNDEISLARSQLIFLRNKIKNMGEGVSLRLARQENEQKRSAFGWKEKYNRLKQKFRKKGE